jgi:hypothetical protein
VSFSRTILFFGYRPIHCADAQKHQTAHADKQFCDSGAVLFKSCDKIDTNGAADASSYRQKLGASSPSQNEQNGVDRPHHKHFK